MSYIVNFLLTSLITFQVYALSAAVTVTAVCDIPQWKSLRFLED